MQGLRVLMLGQGRIEFDGLALYRAQDPQATDADRQAAAMIFNSPPQVGQCSMSMSKRSFSAD